MSYICGCIFYNSVTLEAIYDLFCYLGLELAMPAWVSQIKGGEVLLAMRGSI